MSLPELEKRSVFVTNDGICLRNPSSFSPRTAAVLLRSQQRNSSMQAGPPPEDLHAILGRFHTWSGKQPANGNGRAKGAPEEGIREIPYEEAIRSHRNRQAAASRRRPAQKPQAAAPPQPSAQPTKTPSVTTSEPAEELPLWVANLPVVPDTEPVIELKAAPPPDVALEHEPFTMAPRTASRPAPPPRPARAVTEKRSTAATLVPGNISDAPLPAFSDLPARAFVDLPPTSLSQRSKPHRKTAAPSTASQQAKFSPATVEVSRLPEPPPAAPTPPPAPKTRPSALTTKSAPAPSASRTQRQARTATPAKLTARPAAATSAIIRSTSKIAPALPSQPAIPRRATPTRSARQKPRAAKRAQFSKVLANTVRQPQALLASRNKPAPDRTRRITTRFSPAEERRIEKCAAELGLTVSAYMRQCALAAVTQKPLPESPEPPPAIKSRKPPARASQEPMQYAAPAPSLLGGWLALLRNRFLGPPIRFSEDA